MADAPDLGSGGATRGGSSPLARTIHFREKMTLMKLTNSINFEVEARIFLAFSLLRL